MWGSGCRALLAGLPAAQVRALFPGPDAFVDRTGRGPRTLVQLRRLLAEEHRQGYALEESHVTTGFASIAVAAYDHTGRPVAAFSVTFPADALGPDERAEVVRRAGAAAQSLTRRLGGPAKDLL
jgi:DNA-binding IclR family transcriptional regulator